MPLAKTSPPTNVPDRPKTGSWWRSYERLLRFVERQGTARVPAEHVERGFQLGQWVRTQRSRRQRLSEAQAEALSGLPGWVWDVGDAQWNKAYRLLVAYTRKHRSSAVPKGFEENGFKLGQWVKTQRVRKAGLTPDRISALEDLPGWVWSVYEAKWDEAYEILRSYYEREKHLRIPASHLENGFRLGAWLYGQRRALLNGRLSRRRQELLDSLSREWRGATRAGGGSRRGRKRERFEEIDSVHQAEAVYEALFGLGPMTARDALLAASDHLRSLGMADYRRFRSDGPLAVAVRGAIDLCVQLGYFDRPRRGYLRAVLPDPDDYQPEDWEFCVLESMGERTVTRDEAVLGALEFASANLGLDRRALKKGSPGRRRIEKAIAAAVKSGRIRSAGSRKIRRVS